MTTSELHAEVRNWNKLDNLIEYAKFRYSNTFPHLYWACGIFIAMFVLINQKENLVPLLGIWGFLGLMGFLTLLIILMITLVNGAQKKAMDNLEYLYRKKDGQRGY